MPDVMLVAWHYPYAEHREEMIQRVRDAAEVFRSTSGCLAADVWLDDESGAVVATGRFDSDDAVRRSFAAVTTSDVDFDPDERESRPRAVMRLVAAARRGA
jgi:hypothetical protein